MRSATRSGVAQVSLLGVTAVWGLTFVLTQEAVARVSVLSFLAERFLIAAALVAVVSVRQLRALSPAGWRAGSVMGACLTGGYLLQTYGLRHTSAAHSGFITGLFVVFVPLLAATTMRRRPSRTIVTGVAMSLAGLALLAGGGTHLHALGDGLTLGCAVVFSLHILVTARAAQQGYSNAALLVVQLTVCGGLCAVAALATQTVQAPHGQTVWTALLVTAVLASALAYFVQTAAQRHAPPERTALIMAAEPAFAGLFAYLIRGEGLSGLGWLGATLILGAIVLVELVPRRRSAPAPTPEGPPAPELVLEVTR